MRFAVCFLSAVMAISCWPCLAEEPVSFVKEVAPLLVTKCLACHGAQEPKGDYQLHTYQVLMDGASVEAEDPDSSDLYLRLVDEDAEIRMPKDADPLPAEQIALVKRWIAEGAKFDGEDTKAALTSIIPKAAHPEPPAEYPSPVAITAPAFSPDGKELAAGGYHEITIWNAQDGSLLRRIKNIAQRTYGLDYSADGKLLAAASGTPGKLGEVKLLNPADGSLVKDLATMADCAFDVAFSPDGKRVASSAADRSIRVFDVASGEEQVLIEDHADWVMSVAWSPDGKLLASASRDKTAKVFDSTTGDAQATYNGHSASVFGSAFSEDGKQVLTGGEDKQIRVWNPADGKEVAKIGGFGNEVYEVNVVAGQIFSASADKTARQFDAAKRNQVRSFAGHNDWVFSVAYHDGSKRLASGGFDGEIIVWNVEDGAIVTRFFAAPGYATAEAAP